MNEHNFQTHQYPSSDGLIICPNCNEKQFNDKTGLCLVCGYDEKVWGFDPYYDYEYDDDYDDYDYDYQPENCSLLDE